MECPPGLDQRRDGLRIHPTICPFQGAAASYPWGFEERRIGAISPRVRENLAPCGGLSPSTVEGPPRGGDRRSTIRLFFRRRSLVLPRARGNHAPPLDGCARYLRPFIIISLNAEQPHQFEPRATAAANVADLPARVAEPVPRSVAIRRNRRRDRLFHRARDRPAGSLFGIRTNSHHDDRPRIGGSVDHAGGNEVLRRSVNAGRAQA